jgi:hypothetical protein
VNGFITQLKNHLDFKHPQPLIEVNFKSGKPKTTVVHVRMCSFLFCNDVKLSINTLVLVTY